MGGGGLGLLAGAALELDLVGQAGDAVEQAALVGGAGLGQAGLGGLELRAQGCERGLVGLAGRALGLEVGTQPGEHRAVRLPRRLHLGAQLRRGVRATSTRSASSSACRRLPRRTLRGQVVAQRGERGLVGLPRRPLGGQLGLASERGLVASARLLDGQPTWRRRPARSAARSSRSAASADWSAWRAARSRVSSS